MNPKSSNTSTCCPTHFAVMGPLCSKELKSILCRVASKGGNKDADRWRGRLAWHSQLGIDEVCADQAARPSFARLAVDHCHILGMLVQPLVLHRPYCHSNSAPRLVAGWVAMWWSQFIIRDTHTYTHSGEQGLPVLACTHTHHY